MQDYEYAPLHSDPLLYQALADDDGEKPLADDDDIGKEAIENDNLDEHRIMPGHGVSVLSCLSLDSTTFRKVGYEQPRIAQILISPRSK